MKITKVEVLRVKTNRPSWRPIFCRIHTDEGIYGDGEAAMAYDAGAPAAYAMIKDLAPTLIGMDPMQIEWIWETFFRTTFWGLNAGPVMYSAMSAIDIALWDIAGKYYGVPIYKLLGGKCRDKVRVYAHVFAKNDEELVKNCRLRREQGFTAVGHLSPFLDEPVTMPYEKTHVTNMEESIRRVHLMREAVGDDIDLCIELHRRSLPAEAVVLIHEIEDVHPLFVEDPIPPGNNDAMAYVVSKSNIPIATGERLHTLFEFQDLLDKHATDYVRISLTTVGGFTGARKIAALAETKMCPVVPHNPLSPVCTAAEMQFCMSIDNLLICEYPDPDGPLMGDRGHAKSELVTNCFRAENGYVTVPDTPGLGLELVEDVDKRFPAVEFPVMCRLNGDGSIRDQ